MGQPLNLGFCEEKQVDANEEDICVPKNSREGGLGLRPDWGQSGNQMWGWEADLGIGLEQAQGLGTARDQLI